MFLDDSCKQSKPHSKKATQNTKNKFAGFSTGQIIARPEARAINVFLKKDPAILTDKLAVFMVCIR
jgi:hypothetical protein